jgi:hypothetical protein
VKGFGRRPRHQAASPTWGRPKPFTQLDSAVGKLGDAWLADEQATAGNAGRWIVRVGDVLERLSREFIGRIAKNAAHRFVDPEPPALGRDKTNTDWCIIERDPEPRLAVGESAPGLDLLGNRLSK